MSSTKNAFNMTIPKGRAASEMEGSGSKSESFSRNIYGFASRNMKTLLVGLVFIASLHPFLFASNPGSGKDLKGHGTEVYSPGRGTEQSAAGQESESPAMMAAPSAETNAPLAEAELMASPSAVNETDQLTKHASPEILNSEVGKSEASRSQPGTTTLAPDAKSPKATLKSLKDLRKGAHGPDGEALSLLWIVLLVVLLLWLLGFGFGLGPFVHLLLVVFLILLILWLLRVI